MLVLVHISFDKKHCEKKKFLNFPQTSGWLYISEEVLKGFLNLVEEQCGGIWARFNNRIDE